MTPPLGWEHSTSQNLRRMDTKTGYAQSTHRVLYLRDPRPRSAPAERGGGGRHFAHSLVFALRSLVGVLSARHLAGRFLTILR